MVRTLIAGLVGVVVFALSPAVTRGQDLWLPPLLADGMVLQADRPATLWGKAAPSASVRVAVDDSSQTVTADAAGRWQATVGPLPAGGPHRLTITAGEQTVTIQDVLVGQVWLCSGQSNMAMQLKATDGAEAEIKASADPLLRVVTVSRVPKTEPQIEVPLRRAGGKTGSPWIPASAQHSGDFSATAYYFAKSIRQATGQPVGLVVSAYGGSMIRAWTDPQTLSQPELSPVMQAWEEHLAKLPTLEAEYAVKKKAWDEEAAKAKEEKRKPSRAPSPPIRPGSHNSPAALYNGMLHPLVPYTFRGMIWYQGESDAQQPDVYAVHFPIFVQSIRRHFRDDKLPVYFVQLASYGRPDQTGFATIREVQRRCMAVPHSGMATAIDVGMCDDIHPRNKKAVGERLARWALARDYGQQIEVSGPLPRAARVQGNRVIVELDHAQGLKTGDGAAPACFELADHAGHFTAANAFIDGQTIVLEWPESRPPSKVRYAWAGCPPVNLFNGDDLPAVPFEMMVK